MRSSLRRKGVPLSEIEVVSMSSPLAETPLAAWHRSQNARMAEFAGYEMPIQYEGIVAEHQATRNAVGIFDISHMGRLRFEGREQSNF